MLAIHASHFILIFQWKMNSVLQNERYYIHQYKNYSLQNGFEFILRYVVYVLHYEHVMSLHNNIIVLKQHKLLYVGIQACFKKKSN